MPLSPTETHSSVFAELDAELSRVVIGQPALTRGLIIGLLADGHVLLEGVPGLAKTLAARALAAAIDCRFRRVQFTPDLLPADVIGTMVYHQRTGEFTVQRGPIFSQLLLADEINRAPAKVQSALLEAMQEKQVTIGGQTFPLDEPFLVLATQNPIEHEGTYPLPEAQVDRFLLKLLVHYPARQDEAEILDRLTSGSAPVVRPVIDASGILRARRAVDAIALDPKARDYALDIIRATREKNPLVEYGASPRAAIGLVRAAKANAFLEGRGWVAPEDIKAVAPDVLRHRVILTYEADAERVTADDVITRILDTLRVP
ncbi:MAG TPA: AAA family ATPase [Gemmatimonadaceae bacterium]|nr:AAA family ATPase [Gemmatimonadaceae bacterium]